MSSTAFTLWLLLVPAMPRDAAVTVNTPPVRERSVKQFDFDEQARGNFETMPLHWRPIYGPGYPRFLEPRFDLTTGHSAPPSFKFPVTGGNAGAIYAAKDISAHPDCDYAITAWIRTQNLIHSNATLSAYYLDDGMNKIGDSERVCDVANGETDGEWKRVSTQLTGGFDNARWIGLACHVEHPTAMNAVRPIPYEDVDGAAWFDDIAVTRMPRVALRTASAGQVFTADRAIEFAASVADLDSRDLMATLDVLDAEKKLVASFPVDISTAQEAGQVIDAGDLGAGLYTARLRAVSGERTLVERDISFIRLNADFNFQNDSTGGFGVALDDSAMERPETTVPLLDALSPEHVAMNVWRGDVRDSEILKGDKALERVMDRCVSRNIKITAVLSQPPAGLRTSYDKNAGIFDVLASAAEKWRAFVALPMSRYSSRIETWQLGAVPTLPSQAQLEKGTANFRQVAGALLGPARIAVAWPLDSALDDRPLTGTSANKGKPNADLLTLYAPSDVTAAKLAPYLEKYAKHGKPFRMVLTPPQHVESQNERISEWARRMIVARSCGADVVWTPQAWCPVSDATQAEVALDERFIVERTISQTIGGLAPAGDLWINNDELEGYLFADGKTGEGALAIWTKAEDSKPRDISLDVGALTKSIDLWGNVATLESSESGRKIRVGPMPVILRPVNPRLMQTLASFDLDHPGVQSDIREQTRMLSLTNRLNIRLTATMRLLVPRGWHIEPEHVQINLAPGEMARWETFLTVPTNAASDDYELKALMDKDGKTQESLTLSTPIHVGAMGLKMSVFSHLEDGELKVIQRVTNTTERKLQLRCSLTGESLPRQTRLIPQLPPGSTVSREYSVSQPELFSGRQLRASVEEIDGTLRLHQLIKCD